MRSRFPWSLHWNVQVDGKPSQHQYDSQSVHWQGGFESIQFQSTAEHADFNGIRIREIDRRVSSGTGILGVAHLFERGEATAVPRRPAVHLALRTAAKVKQLRPEFLNEVQQASNRGFLLLIGTAKGQARDVNMKAASVPAAWLR